MRLVHLLVLMKRKEVYLVAYSLRKLNRCEMFACFQVFLFFFIYTGAFSHIIDRGSHAINFILLYTVFNLRQTILEISMASSILAYKFRAPFAWITSPLCSN
ncbi:unnamed protein product [Coffea canephora]|uniref:Uncharacterized protein n=1 Tax=Coffea canephora TaxID=49390 RepID=A0A068V783_COFCA|nr:unnamed protein product [Coffea canephora]